MSNTLKIVIDDVETCPPETIQKFIDVLEGVLKRRTPAPLESPVENDAAKQVIEDIQIHFGISNNLKKTIRTAFKKYCALSRKPLDLSGLYKRLPLEASNVAFAHATTWNAAIDAAQNHINGGK